jgi:hypothetical protein
MDTYFPYKKYYIDKDKLFQKALKYRPVYIPFKKLNDKKKHTLKNYIIGIQTHSRSPFLDINDLTDCFSEKCRVQCRVERRDMSFIEFYHKNKIDLVLKLDAKGIPLTFKSLNQIAYNSYLHCTNYKLTYLLGILEYFKPKKWLDMSAGWGDRLLSAIIYDRKYGLQKYQGIDPSICMKPIYEKIINTFGDANALKFNVAQSPAETYTIKENFDFIFTSPPFFTYEIYETNNTNQSIANFNSVDLWLNNFLFVTINKAWEKLSPKGHYVLYIEDKGYDFIDKLLAYMRKKRGSFYKGIIYQVFTDPRFKNPNIFHTVYVWEKKY